MASDDNPFARNSAWPKMPQAPFRIGPLARTAPPGPPREPEAAAPPAGITPLYVRPTEAATPTVLAVGRVAPRAERPTASPPEPRPAPPEARPAQAPASAAPADGVRELEAVVVQPVARPVRPARRRSLPLIGAGLVGVAGLAVLAFVLLQGRQAAPPSPSPSPVAAAPAIAEPATPGPAVTAEAAPPPEPAPPERAQPAPAQLAARTPAPARAAPPPRIAPPPQPAAAAVEEAINAPVLDLPRPAPLPAYAPPTAPDPNAPMTTRRPY